MAWKSECYGSPMFQVASKIKKCRIDLLKWNSSQESNSATMIQKLKAEMEEMKESDGVLDGEKWNGLKDSWSWHVERKSSTGAKKGAMDRGGR